MIDDVVGLDQVPDFGGHDAWALIHRAATGAPAFSSAVRRFGMLTIAEYLDRLVIAPATDPVGGGVAEVADAVRALAEPVYGEAVANRAATEMLADPIVATTNHSGLDTMADSFHATLLHCVRGQRYMPGRRTAVVLSCGSVSMDNPTFPMGLLYYQPHRLGSRTYRLTLLSHRQRRRMVRTAPRLTSADIARVRARLTSYRVSDSDISEYSRRQLLRALDEDVDRPDIAEAASFDDQSRLINARLWDRSVPTTCARPVYVELERVTALLLARDLRDTSSLIYPLVFDHEVRTRLLRALEGVRGCWRTEVLEQGDPRGGTHLFWTVSPHGSRVPVVVRSQGGSDRLVEVTAATDPRSWELAPEPLAQAIAAEELIPALPTCFTVVSSARGVGCLGGYYQSDYLPRVHAAVQTTLEQCGIGDHSVDIPMGWNLAGIQAILGRDTTGTHIPLGPIALASEGGLSEQEIAGILRTPMVEAQVAALSEILVDLLAVREVAEPDAERLVSALSDARGMVYRAVGR